MLATPRAVRRATISADRSSRLLTHSEVKALHRRYTVEVLALSHGCRCVRATLTEALQLLFYDPKTSLFTIAGFIAADFRALMAVVIVAVAFR